MDRKGGYEEDIQPSLLIPYWCQKEQIKSDAGHKLKSSTLLDEENVSSVQALTKRHLDAPYERLV